ncbi:MAG: PEP/pyruvate-binding domain-containing protein [Xanthomonadales bacterium]|jgi:hypothetical protein|nr:PEP/pyruvate-binding domain-containing protein [Xanthomonadales bacterium]
MNGNPMQKNITNLLIALFALIVFSPPGLAQDETRSEYRAWIEEMKEADRGPFARIRWFCNDGSVLPPKAYACSSHGGGHQHGEWSDRTRTLREEGYLVANLLAGIDVDAFLADPGAPEHLAQILIERYLVGADDGWIFRRALFYRGAIQEEDEREGARKLLRRLAVTEDWVEHRFALLRTAVRMLPHGADNASVQKVRQMSASLSDRDAGFKPLRAKIHGAPAAGDAARVRDYAAGLPEENRPPYLALADEIDRVYQAAPLQKELRANAAQYTAAPWLQELLTSAADELEADPSASGRFSVTAALLADLRRALPKIGSAGARLDVLDLSLRAEGEHFRAAAELREMKDPVTRRGQLDYLAAAGKAAYGTGLVNARLLDELNRSLEALAGEEAPLGRYQAELAYLGRVPGWGTQALRMPFYGSMEKLAEIEPMAMLFIQDQLRGSPLLFFSQLLDGLSRDANRLAGVKHRLFGETIGTGFTALNPGLASGVLHVEPDLSDLENFRPDGIYLLPETVSDLPPVAGILTQGEGNPLSHVQLLARNLGIPNVTVDGSMVERLQAHDGERVVLAVSPSGLVELSAWNDEWATVFEEASSEGGVVIRPDLDKLDLSVRRFLPLDDLRASDSGRTVGPKAAKLGELRSHYPGRVSQGVAIPFGLFRQEALEQPHPGGGTVFDWMAKTYRELEAMPAGDPERAARTEAFRAELYDIILDTKPSSAFVEGLHAALREAFGDEDPPGVFVRSDTNVEDLAGFTGAGLNLTLPNVVGADNLMKSIARVWASPFTARAFAWRQSHMTAPEHVYTSILLLESVASDKSGVLVTQDIDTGAPDVISVAVNEGLGGAVDGQAAESLRIPLDGSPPRVLATATAPWRRVPDPAGGLQFLRSSGSDSVLQPAEIAQLIEFAKGLPTTFPPITDDEGNPAPADIEFGFLGGELRLFQLRPFLDSKAARGTGYLQRMEARTADTSDVLVNLNGAPE